MRRMKNKSIITKKERMLKILQVLSILKVKKLPDIEVKLKALCRNFFLHSKNISVLFTKLLNTGKKVFFLQNRYVLFLTCCIENIFSTFSRKAV